MTEGERKLFETEKENARKRLDEMYRARPQSAHSHSAPRPEGEANTNKQNFKTTAENENRQPPKSKENPAPSFGGLDLLKMLNFDKIDMDNDRLVLLMLCLLLSGENADEMLILALTYIML